VATWPNFARRELPTLIQQLKLPCARTTTLNRCPLHDTVVGPVTGLCERCVHAAWDEVARRYASRAQGEGRHRFERAGHDQINTTREETLMESAAATTSTSRRG
jgi:hypothetical protein